MKRSYGGEAEEPRERNIPLDFHCGICGRELTDNNALLTSCGHFFCASGDCTVLAPGINATCEVCGRQCDAGSLRNQAKGYDDRVKSFVFGDPVADIKQVVEMLEFRERHVSILRDNFKRTLSENESLNDVVKQLKNELAISKSENQALKKQIGRLKRRNDGNVTGHVSSRVEPRSRGKSRDTEVLKTKFDVGRTIRAAPSASFRTPRRSAVTDGSAYTSRTTGSLYNGKSSFTINGEREKARFVSKRMSTDDRVRRSSTFSKSQPKISSHSRKRERISLPSPASVVNQISRFASSSRNTPVPSVTPEDLSRAAKRRRSSVNPLAPRR